MVSEGLKSLALIPRWSIGPALFWSIGLFWSQNAAGCPLSQVVASIAAWMLASLPCITVALLGTLRILAFEHAPVLDPLFRLLLSFLPC
jgi:hypothetical protein